MQWNDTTSLMLLYFINLIEVVIFDGDWLWKLVRGDHRGYG